MLKNIEVVKISTFASWLDSTMVTKTAPVIILLLSLAISCIVAAIYFIGYGGIAFYVLYAGLAFIAFCWLFLILLSGAIAYDILWGLPQLVVAGFIIYIIAFHSSSLDERFTSNSFLSEGIIKKTEYSKDTFGLESVRLETTKGIFKISKDIFQEGDKFVLKTSLSKDGVLTVYSICNGNNCVAAKRPS